MRDVAIIGAGFCGTMLAVNLARKANGKTSIALIERGAAPARGVAYGTTDPQHLLNVRAGNMSAFADDPGHFLRWLEETHPDSFVPDSFVPRATYGDYLADILQRAKGEFASLEVISADIVDLMPVDGAYQLHGAQGVAAEARQVVLALGNFPPGSGNPEQAVNPYARGVLDRLAEPGDVFLIGSGLTSLDLLVTAARVKTEGRVHVLSRSGMFPQVHAIPFPYPAFLDAANLPRTALTLLRVIRSEVRRAARQGVAWQSVLDSLRPLNQKPWQGLPLSEKLRFLRRLRGFWDTHRHRCAPEIMSAYQRLAAAGRLTPHRGAFVSLRETPDGMAVTWKPPGGDLLETTDVRCAVDCTGPQSDLRRVTDLLVQRLLERDLIVPDTLRLGIETAADGAVMNSSGATVAGLFTLGTWRKAALYESVAVPELRVQAADLAARLLEMI